VFLQEVEANLIITDYCMPGMTGYDLLGKIKVYIGFYCRYPEIWNLKDKQTCGGNLTGRRDLVEEKN
jgi:hypothetical protein